EIIEGYVRKKNTMIKPVVVSSGPCKENIHIGEEVDLFEFPTPILHEGDGGRYIGTWHAVVTKDPDSEWVNWGMYRIMIHDKTTMGGLFNPSQHNGMIFYHKYEARGNIMEFAAVIGTEPVNPLISATFIAAGVNEVDVIGGIRGEPVELVKCETVDLYVPSTSEIVIEGVVHPHERKDEGPFGEYTGYRTAERAPRPIYRVKAITHRNDPILPTSCMGVPVDDSAGFMPFFTAGEILDDLRKANLPVRMVYSPPYGVTHIVFVSTKVPYANYPRYLANAIWGSRAGLHTWFLVIVEDDVDVTNLNEVIWALTTRCHPDKGIHKVPNAPAHPLLPFLSPYERRYNLGAQVFFDCTWPKDWPPETIPVKSSFDVLWPKEIQEKVLANWEQYGYKAE
ncbi:MAG: UbiD family decarboxylase, partial [bacterium]|nr:UbiD family decarboxylase [bacterium]